LKPRRHILFTILMGLAIYGYFRGHKSAENSSPQLIRSSSETAAQQNPSSGPSIGENALTMTHPSKGLIRLRELFAQKKFAEALAIAQQLQDSETLSKSERQWLTAQIPIIKTALGWKFLHANDCDQALFNFSSAHKSSPSTESSKGMIFCRYRLEHFPEVVELGTVHLERYVFDVEVAWMVADSQESLGRFNDALKNLKLISAQKNQTFIELQDLEERILAMQAKADQAPRQNFEINQPFALTYPENLGDDFIVWLVQTAQEALSELTSSYGALYPKRNIEIILYETQQFRKVTNYAPEWAQGLFDGRIRLPVYSQQSDRVDVRASIKKVLRHELAHAILAQMTDIRQLPSWFNEGFAQYFEISDHNEFLFDAKKTQFLKSSQLHKNYSNLIDSSSARQSYLNALYMIRTLNFGYQKNERLHQIVRKLPTNLKNDSDLLLSPLGISFSDLYEESRLKWQESFSFNAD
jgi:hypothetical protein